MWPFQTANRVTQNHLDFLDDLLLVQGIALPVQFSGPCIQVAYRPQYMA